MAQALNRTARSRFFWYFDLGQALASERESRAARAKATRKEAQEAQEEGAVEWAVVQLCVAYSSPSLRLINSNVMMPSSPVVDAS